MSFRMELAALAALYEAVDKIDEALNMTSSAMARASLVEAVISLKFAVKQIGSATDTNNADV